MKEISMQITEDEANELAHKIDYTYDSGESARKVYHLIGGTETFGKTKLSAGYLNLLNAILRQGALPEEEYVDLLEAMNTIPKKVSVQICNYKYSLTRPELFKKIYASNPARALHIILDGEFFSHFTEEWQDAVWEALPFTHESSCLGPGACLCERIVLFNSYKSRELAQNLKEKIIRDVHPEIMEIFYKNILTSTKDNIDSYARSILVADEDWDKLLNDYSRGIITSLSSNGLLPTNIAHKIIANHKSGELRENIARYSDDKELLETIWDSTKSDHIRKNVYQNTASGMFQR